MIVQRTVRIQECADMTEDIKNDLKKKYIEGILEQFKGRGYEIIETENRQDKFVISYKIPEMITGYVLRLVINWTEVF